ENVTFVEHLNMALSVRTRQGHHRTRKDITLYGSAQLFYHCICEDLPARWLPDETRQVWQYICLALYVLRLHRTLNQCAHRSPLLHLAQLIERAKNLVAW